MSENQNQPNYIGSSYLSEYEGTFNGFVTYYTLADLEELKKFMSPDGRVGVRTQFAKDPSKAYSKMFTPKVREPKAEGAESGLPF
jgi:hypothetical protein